MYDNLEQEISIAICNKHPELSLKEIKEIVEGYFENKMALIWDTYDVIKKAKELGLEITEEQARNVLSYIRLEYNHSDGVTWDTISHTISEMFIYPH